jgi:hypothetical protein
MTTVQIAIQDRRYARALRALLLADGYHCVHIVNYPNSAVDGVVVADEKLLDQLRNAHGVDFSRYILFIRKLDYDADKLFETGMRYLIHADTPAEIGRLIVLAAERQLNEAAAVVEHVPSHVPERDLASLLDAADRVFLQALRISDC